MDVLVNMHVVMGDHSSAHGSFNHKYKILDTITNKSHLFWPKPDQHHNEADNSCSDSRENACKVLKSMTCVYPSNSQKLF